MRTCSRSGRHPVDAETLTERRQYLIETAENASLANNPNATDILPTLDIKGRPVIGFGYGLIANRTNSLADLSDAGVLTGGQQIALTEFLGSHTGTLYASSELTTLQGIISLPTQADEVWRLRLEC